MQELLNIYHQVPWSAFWLAAGGGSAVAVFSQLLKKWLGLDSEKAIYLLVMFLGAFGSAMQYLLNAKGLPVSVLGIHTAAVLGIAQPLYLYFIKPLDNFLGQVKSYMSSQDAKAKTASDAAVNAVNPPASLLSEPDSVASSKPEQPTNTANF